MGRGETMAVHLCLRFLKTDLCVATLFLCGGSQATSSVASLESPHLKLELMTPILWRGIFGYLDKHCT